MEFLGCRRQSKEQNQEYGRCKVSPDGSELCDLAVSAANPVPSHCADTRSASGKLLEMEENQVVISDICVAVGTKQGGDVNSSLVS